MLKLSAEVDGEHVRIVATFEGDRPIEGAIVNIMAPYGQTLLTSDKLDPLKSHFPLNNPELGRVDALWCERTIYPEATYIFEARIQSEIGPVRCRAEMSGWAGKTVEAAVDFDVS